MQNMLHASRCDSVRELGMILDKVCGLHTGQCVHLGQCKCLNVSISVSLFQGRWLSVSVNVSV